MFDVKPGLKTICAAHPTEAKNINYRRPGSPDTEDTLTPIGTMVSNDDGSWTIRLSAPPSSGTLIAKPHV